VTIPHIFDVEGEAGFRQRESATLFSLVEADDLVLATGGGAILAEQNREMLQQNGIVIYLKATVHELWQRTKHDRNRPLLQTDDPHGRLAALFHQRDPIYQQVADIVIHSGKQSAHTLMLHLVDEIEAYTESN
jgi:shikimate kinase